MISRVCPCRQYTHIFLAERVTFHSCALWMAQVVWGWKVCASSFLCSLPSRSLMSLQNPSLFFPTSPIFSNLLTMQILASATFMGRSWIETPCEPARWSGMSGRMANPAPNTDYEPILSNFFSYMDTAHTPIHLSDSHQPRLPVPGRRNRDLHHKSRRLAVLRSILQQQANNSKQGSHNVRNFSGNSGEIMSRLTVVRASRKLVQMWMDNLFVPTIFSVQSKGKRVRHTNVNKKLWTENWLGRPRRENGSADIVWSWGWGRQILISLFMR